MSEMIGFIAAMDEEVDAIKNIMKNTEEIKYLEFILYCGIINNKKCILVKSGIGKVNAAIITQILIDKYDVKQIINIGTAGSCNDNIKCGDIIIGQYLIQHDFDITAFGHKKGYIPNVGEKIESNKELIQKCNNIIKKQTEEKYIAKIGTIVSGDIFCTSIKMKEGIYKNFEADCIEMEGAAVAQVCYLNKIPFIVIRSISDTPNEENEKMFYENLKMSTERCADFIKKIL